ncbi:MAG: hypothetical protein JRE64_18485 [Deltaproteobacteria bacterium]|nr:hypothetical protein [Deltaproteobacteria bacterium]
MVIIELKKGRTPREVITQLLEYAAWANDLSDEKIHDIATNYIKSINTEKDIETLFFETFETDEIPSLNQRLRLFVAAEEISPSVAKVCRFLRQVHGVDVNCIQFNIFQTESGEVLVNSEAFVGLEDVVAPKKRNTPILTKTLLGVRLYLIALTIHLVIIILVVKIGIGGKKKVNINYSIHQRTSKTKQEYLIKIKTKSANQSRKHITSLTALNNYWDSVRKSGAPTGNFYNQ